LFEIGKNKNLKPFALNKYEIKSRQEAPFIRTAISTSARTNITTACLIGIWENALKSSTPGWLGGSIPQNRTATTKEKKENTLIQP
jgi:hypothetical protein